MKISRALRFSLLALAGAVALRGFDPTKPFPKTEVVFFEPEIIHGVWPSSLELRLESE